MECEGRIEESGYADAKHFRKPGTQDAKHFRKAGTQDAKHFRNARPSLQTSLSFTRGIHLSREALTRPCLKNMFSR